MSEINKDNDLLETLNDFFLHKLKQLDFCTVGVIKEYDSSTSTATIQPSPKLDFEGQEEQVEQALIYDVPVMNLGAEGFVIHSDGYVGSDCIIIWSTHDLSYFKKGVTFEVDKFSMFDYNSCMAIPVTSSNSVTEKEGITVQTLDGKSFIQLKKDGEINLENENGNVKLKADGEVDLTTQGGTTNYKNDGSILFQNGAKVDTTGDFITKSGISLDKHGHTGNLGNPTTPAIATGGSAPSGMIIGNIPVTVPDVKTPTGKGLKVLGG